MGMSIVMESKDYKFVTLHKFDFSFLSLALEKSVNSFVVNIGEFYISKRQLNTTIIELQKMKDDNKTNDYDSRLFSKMIDSLCSMEILMHRKNERVHVKII